MKSIVIFSFALILSAISCKNQPTDAGKPLDQITFLTDSDSYTKSDTIDLVLENNLSSDVTVGLRCGVYLEMFYQKKENENWGDSLWLPYMSLRCLTNSDTIWMNTSFTHSIPAEMFSSTGTFRLAVDIHLVQKDTSFAVFSGPFSIQQ